jgi:hypothetical protein
MGGGVAMSKEAAESQKDHSKNADRCCHPE